MKIRSVFQRLQRHGSVLLLAAILLIQALALVHIGSRRDGLHIDEHYSYILSNSYSTDRIANAPEVWDQWVSGDAFRKFLTVEPGEQFAYRTVYDNNSKDAHPPLFYFLLHTLCSLLPGVWSPWIGMAMNIVLILLTQVVLYKLSRDLMGSSLWSVVPAVIYGGMQVFADTALFIRMYPLMTLLTVLLVWQHFRLATGEKKLRPIIWCGILTFLGTFTQYYFAFVAFFLAAAGCIFLLVQKKWKPLLGYAAAMLLGVILVFAVFPAGITQITGSDTNNVGKEVAANLLNFSDWGPKFSSMVKTMRRSAFSSLKQAQLPTVIFAGITLAALVAVRFFRGASSRKGEKSKQALLFGLVLAAVVSLAVAAIVHVSGKFQYIRYVYNLFPLIALLIALALWLLADAVKCNKHILALGVTAVFLLSTATIAKNEMFSYMYHERAERDQVIAEACADKPLIVFNNGSTYQPTALLHILLRSDRLYMANYNTFDSMDTVLQQVDCSNGVVYLVLSDTYWSNGFDGQALMTEVVEQSELLADFSTLGTADFTTVYIAYPEG